jgi:hypothetical protein
MQNTSKNLSFIDDVRKSSGEMVLPQREEDYATMRDSNNYQAVQVE